MRWSYFLTCTAEAAIDEAKHTKSRPDSTERWISFLEDAREQAIERREEYRRLGCSERRIIEPGEGELTPSEKLEERYMRNIRALELAIFVAYLPHYRESVRQLIREEAGVPYHA